jgi:hypothetical protein
MGFTGRIQTIAGDADGKTDEGNFVDVKGRVHEVPTDLIVKDRVDYQPFVQEDAIVGRVFWIGWPFEGTERDR